ncbi:TetR/AcrR family transcriptional regulator [Thermophilibacter provencensis]|uniref:TetR/AcrR family transcriptional regulator n=1 Tax=Thermophilibacter provencensis TaxID=1852386 RepID=UPI003AA854CB
MGDCAQGEKNGRAVDRRVRRSRRAMMGAFDRLIMTTPFEQISVSAVAREADVDRKTVYQHFGGVDGILDAIVEEAVSELLDEVEETMRDRVGAGEDVRPLSAFFDALSVHLGKNAVLRQRYCEHVPTELLFDHLARPLARQIAARGLVRGELSDTELEMLLAFGVGGLLSLYRWWLLSDRSVPLEEVTRRAGALLEAGV